MLKSADKCHGDKCHDQIMYECIDDTLYINDHHLFFLRYAKCRLGVSPISKTNLQSNIVFFSSSVTNICILSEKVTFLVYDSRFRLVV